MRFLLGVVLAGAAFFMWGFLYWGMSPLPGKYIQSVGDSEATFTAELKSSLETGVYKYPAPPLDMGDEAAMEAFNEKHRTGPLYMLFYRQNGCEPNSQMLFGFLHSILLAFIGALIILAASPQAYANRVMLIFWVAVFGTVWAELGNVIWWNYPWSFCWLEMGYHIGGGLVIGLILAAFVRPDPEMA